MTIKNNSDCASCERLMKNYPDKAGFVGICRACGYRIESILVGGDFMFVRAG